MSDQVTIGDYSLEISGGEVLVRDENGTVVEEVKLDDVQGDFTLPDGQKIDLVALLADKGVDTLQTAAGAANDNAGSANGGSGIFHAFGGDQGELGGFHSAGALGDTSPTSDTPDSGHQTSDSGPQLGRSNFDWAQHDPESHQNGSPSRSGDQQTSSGGGSGSDQSDGGDDEQDFQDFITPPASDHSPSQTGDQSNDPSTPPTDEQQPSVDDNESEDPVTPPTDEQQSPANDDQGSDPVTPPSDEQQLPANDDQGNDSATPPTDEQQPPVNDNEGDDPAAPPADEQQPPVDDNQGNDPVTPPSDEQQPPANDDQSNDPVTPPSDEQQPPANDDQGNDPASPPTDEQQQPANDDQGDDPVTPPSDEQQPPANDDAGNDPVTPPTDEQQPPTNDDKPIDQPLAAVNAAPTDINLSGNSVVENTVGAIIGALSVVDPDVGDTHTFAVSDDRFEVVSGQLKLKDGVSLDFEQAASLDVTVTATDQAGNQFAEVFSISVGNVNEAQTNMTLSAHGVAENAAGAVIGTLSVSDPDAGDSQSFKVSDNRFEVVNDQLKLKSGVSLDYEQASSVNVTVTATDSANHHYAETFKIDVTNVNEAPVAAATGGTFHVNASLQPTVDFSDVDSNTLSQAVIHTTGFKAGDTLNVPASNLFNVTVNHNPTDYTITIVGKTGTETVDQYENFANSISFSTSSSTAGDRHIGYSVTDSGGLTSNVATADITVNSHQELYTSQLGKGQTILGVGDDILHIDSKNFSPVDMGDGYDTLHLDTKGGSFGHNEAIKLNNVEAIDTTGYGANNVSLSIHDVLGMTDSDHHLTIIGDKGDTITLTNSGNSHWVVADTSADFTTYVYNDPSHQAVVEISNQLNTQVS